MKRFLILGMLCAAAILTPARGWSWNSIGHLASAKLAYDQWDDVERHALFALLQRHPHFAQYLAAGRPADVNEMEWVILRAAVWPDWVRDRHHGPDADPRGPGVTKYSRDEQHYIDVPVIDPNDTAFFAGKTLIPPDRTDVICALKQSCNDLRTKTAAAEDKAVAICWIFHLVGDIHQPLHNAEFFSREEGLEQGDRGGNLLGVKINGRKWKLHAFWDDVLGEDGAYWDDSAEHQQQIFRDAMRVADRLSRLQLSDADKQRLAKNRSFASWSAEGVELARTVAYQKPDGSGILGHVVLKPGEPFPDNAPEAGDRYAEMARAVAEARIALAGRRLARRIQGLLDTRSPTAASGPATAPYRPLSPSAKPLNFPRAHAVDPARLLPAPPTADSPETRAELDLLLALQANRTSEQVARCQAESKLTIAAFQDVLGADFTPEKLPALDGLLKKAAKDVHQATEAAKTHFARPRPARLENKLAPCVGKDKSPSYPSGHATSAMVYALILAELAPDRRLALLERAREIGWNRVVAGAHYPSDVAAGRVLGQAIARALLTDRVFQEELAKVKAELNKVRGKQAA